MPGPDTTPPPDGAPVGVHVVVGPASATAPVVDTLTSAAPTTPVRFDLDVPDEHSRFVAEVPAFSLFGGARVLIAHTQAPSDRVRDVLAHLPAADLLVLVVPKPPKPAVTGPGGSTAAVHVVDADKARDVEVSAWLATTAHELTATGKRTLRAAGDPADTLGLLRALTVLSTQHRVTDQDVAALTAHLPQTTNTGPWRVWDLLWDDRLSDALDAASDHAPLAVWSHISQVLGRARLLLDVSASPALTGPDAQVLGCTPTQAAAARRVVERVDPDEWPRLLRLCVNVDARLKLDPDPAGQLAGALAALHSTLHRATD